MARGSRIEGVAAALLAIVLIALAAAAGTREAVVFADGHGGDVRRYLGLDGFAWNVRATRSLPGHARCQARLARALRDQDRAGADAAFVECEAILVGALSAAPNDGDAWFALASLLTLRDGLSDQAIAALERSYAVAPREFWISARRMPFVLRLYGIAPERVRELAREEILSLARSRNGREALARIYVTLGEAPRAAIVETLEVEPEEAQRAFIATVRRYLRRERGAGA